MKKGKKTDEEQDEQDDETEVDEETVRLEEEEARRKKQLEREKQEGEKKKSEAERKKKEEEERKLKRKEARDEESDKDEDEDEEVEGDDEEEKDELADDNEDAPVKKPSKVTRGAISKLLAKSAAILRPSKASSRSQARLPGVSTAVCLVFLWLRICHLHSGHCLSCQFQEPQRCQGYWVYAILHYFRSFDICLQLVTMEMDLAFFHPDPSLPKMDYVFRCPEATVSNLITWTDV